MSDDRDRALVADQGVAELEMLLARERTMFDCMHPTRHHQTVCFRRRRRVFK